MASVAEHTLDILAEMRATPHDARPARLAKLAKPMLVQLAAAALQQWEQDNSRWERETAELDDRLTRLERLVEEKQP